MRGMRVSVWLAAVVWLAGCGESDTGSASAGADAGGSAATAELTAEELELGLGPIRSVELGDLDPELVSEGDAVFALKCSACHKIAERYVGPPLGDVLTRRRPEYVMNMMLNPAEMVERHPAARELLAQYMNPMPDQNLTESEARAVLEYLRSVQVAHSGAAGPGNE